jgi:hypothetical protein
MCFCTVHSNFFHSTAHLGFLKRYLLGCNAVWSVQVNGRLWRTCHIHLQCWRSSQVINQHERGSLQISDCCLLHKAIIPELALLMKMWKEILERKAVQAISWRLRFLLIFTTVKQQNILGSSHVPTRVHLMLEHDSDGPAYLSLTERERF